MQIIGFSICLIFASLIFSVLIDIYRKIKMNKAVKNFDPSDMTGADTVESISLSPDGKDLIVERKRSAFWYQRNS